MVKRTSSIPRTNVEPPDEVMAAFRQALKIRDHRERQLEDGDRCPGIGGCETCNEYERLVGIVDSALGVRPGDLSPVDVIDGPAAPMWKETQQADWDRARVQHVALAKGAKVKPRTKALLTDACHGPCNVRWVERHCRVPDGPLVGQPLRLHEFQRDVVRSIYGDPRYWQAVGSVLKKKRRAA